MTIDNTSTASLKSTESLGNSFYIQSDDSSASGIAATGQPDFDKSSIAGLVAKHGSASATAWLEFDRYHIWQAQPNQVPESSFPPIQGYMARKQFVFAWGDPLVSDISALAPTARAFIAWAEGEGLHPVWCCADEPLEKVLAELTWSTVECIYEEVLDPDHVIELTSPEAKGQEGAKVVKDLKKNLRRAEKAGVSVVEVTGQWTPEMRSEIHNGVEGWKKNRSGVQIASVSELFRVISSATN